MVAKPRNKSKGTASRRDKREANVKHRWKLTWLSIAALVVVAFVGLNALDQGSAVASPIEFTDVRAQTREFMGYYKSIKLDPEQELVKQEALTGIKAPCCSDNSAYTCCCPCNMAKTWWGLSHYLIKEGHDAEQVEAAVEAWIEFVNPDGFSGNACYTGGCVRPFHRNGCGGMDEERLVF